MAVPPVCFYFLCSWLPRCFLLARFLELLAVLWRLRYLCILICGAFYFFRLFDTLTYTF